MSAQHWIFTAGVISTITAVAHSVLGEMLIFSHLRDGSLVPHLAPAPLPARRTGILWATWHLASVYALGFSALLFALAAQSGVIPGQAVLLTVTSVTYGASAVLVFIGTSGRHPGWVTLLAVCVITGVAAAG